MVQYAVSVLLHKLSSMILLESDRKFCDKFNGEGKVVPAPVMKAYRGSAGIPPVILNLDTRNCIQR